MIPVSYPSGAAICRFANIQAVRKRYQTDPTFYSDNSAVAFLWELPLGVMASQSLEDILGDCGVTPQISSVLITAGWTIENFSCVASDEPPMESIWNELVPDLDLPLLQKSALRAAFKRCRTKMDPSGPFNGSEAMASADASASNASWSESFAPKLDQAKISSLKEKFLCYPSEIVNHEP